MKKKFVKRLPRKFPTQTKSIKTNNTIDGVIILAKKHAKIQISIKFHFTTSKEPSKNLPIKQMATQITYEMSRQVQTIETNKFLKALAYEMA